MEALNDLLQKLASMDWSDYLDIIIVAFLIYQVIPLFHSGSTMRVGRVILLIFGVSLVAQIAELYTLTFLINQLLSVGLIAVVILFQPELRRMLDHLGGISVKRLLGYERSADQMGKVISQTVQACEVMSREKIGALIVFARTQRLDEYFKTGTVIDGKVSEQLIRNIFFPNASLHDGAMIIRDGMVAAAGCVLPLSESNRLSADLGTRHRAGVGMSEHSDAVVVIVSEETGTISVAVGGMLKRHLAPQTLEKLLKMELCKEDAKQGNILGQLIDQVEKKLNSGKEKNHEK